MARELGKVIILCSGKKSQFEKKGFSPLFSIQFTALQLTCGIMSALPDNV